MIYIVTDGCYSDYHICGVYSTKELAEEAKKRFGAEWLEEHELDAMPGKPLGMYRWKVDIDREGNASNIYLASCEDVTEKIDYFFDGYEKLEFLHIEVWAKDEKHAIKIANERRAMLIASGEWDKEAKEIDERYAEFKLSLR